MEYDEIWGISLERIHEFFSAQADAVGEGDTGFRIGDVRVGLTRLPDRVIPGAAMPRTRVEITGPGEGAEAVHRRFFLRFLSAGG